MQKCQDQLEFIIETPSGQELAKRFADNQRRIEELMGVPSVYQQQQEAKQMKTKKNLEEDLDK